MQYSAIRGVRAHMGTPPCINWVGEHNKIATSIHHLRSLRPSSQYIRLYFQLSFPPISAYPVVNTDPSITHQSIHLSIFPPNATIICPFDVQTVLHQFCNMPTKLFVTSASLHPSVNMPIYPHNSFLHPYIHLSVCPIYPHSSSSISAHLTTNLFVISPSRYSIGQYALPSTEPLTIFASIYPPSNKPILPIIHPIDSQFYACQFIYPVSNLWPIPYPSQNSGTRQSSCH
jgi:hypothetical protein